jgi:hypothetical protein
LVEGYAVSVPDAGGFTASRACFEALASELGGAEAAGKTHDVLEDWLAAGCRELTRLLLQDHLRLRTVTEVRRDDVTGAGEQGPRRRVEVGHVRTVTTIFGPVVVDRMAYRASGATNLYPADAQLNLPVGEHSHGLRKLAVLEAVRGSYDQAITGIIRATGVSVGKGQMLALTQAAAIDITGFYQTRRPGPAADTDVLVMTFDGKGVVMRPDGLRAATAQAAAGSRTKLAIRLSKGEKGNRKRLAELGGVYDITPVARTPEDIITEPGSLRLRAPGPVAVGKWLTVSIENDASSVIGDAFDEAHRRDPSHRRTRIALVDGNAHQIRRIRAEATHRGVSVTIICDLIHVLEYLWRAAWCFFPEGDPAVETWVAGHARRILAGHAATVAAAIRRKATTRHLTPTERRNVDVTAGYLLKLRPYLRYDQALAAGWPIATGIIEGACRHIVKDRMDLTGARWGLAGAETILRLRAMISNRDFDDYWTFHLHQEHHHTHHSRYRDTFSLAA